MTRTTEYMLTGGKIPKVASAFVPGDNMLFLHRCEVFLALVLSVTITVAYEDGRPKVVRFCTLTPHIGAWSWAEYADAIRYYIPTHLF